MEFSEKLQKLRTESNLTQQELADKLYVSRTAISKWESGRGYPSIDSIKTIAGYFGVLVDDLLCNDEILVLAQQDIKASRRKYAALTCGVLDALLLLLMFIPIFGCEVGGAVFSIPLLSLTGVSPWLKASFITIISAIALNGFVSTVVLSLNRPRINNVCAVVGVAMSVVGCALFALAKQPYAGFFFLATLSLKGVLLFTAK